MDLGDDSSDDFEQMPPSKRNVFPLQISYIIMFLFATPLPSVLNSNKTHISSVLFKSPKIKFEFVDFRVVPVPCPTPNPNHVLRSYLVQESNLNWCQSTFEEKVCFDCSSQFPGLRRSFSRTGSFKNGAPTAQSGIISSDIAKNSGKTNKVLLSNGVLSNRLNLKNWVDFCIKST